MRPVPQQCGPRPRGSGRTIRRCLAPAAAVVVAGILAAMLPPGGASAADPSTTTTDPTTTTSTQSSTTTSTSVPTTTSSTPSTTTSTTPAPPPVVDAAPAPPADPAPLVTVSTMVQRGDRWGVQVEAVGDVGTDDWKCPELFTTDKGVACFYADPSNGTQWVHLVVLDRRNLALVANRNIVCQTATAYPQENQFDIVKGGSSPWTSNANPCIDGLVQYVSGLNDGHLVIAVNQPGKDPTVQPAVGLGAALSGKFITPFTNHAIGIAAAKWFDAKDNGAFLPKAKRGTFSAIGVPGWTEGGISALASSPDQAGAGKLVASVAIDNANRYSPLPEADPDEAKQSPVTQVLTQAPSQWPGTGAKSKLAALSYVGGKAGLGSHPRNQYYSSIRDGAAWQLAREQIANVAYVENDQFSSGDLDWAKNQLRDEIGYLIEVQSYLAALARPYQTTSATLWADFGEAAARVNETTSNATTAQVIGITREVISAVLEVVPMFGKAAEKVAAATMAAYHLALTVADAANKPADEPFPVESAQLATELTKRLAAAEQEISLAWRKILAADFKKLQTVATCSSSEDECPLPNDAWAVSLGQMAELKRVLELGFERALYTHLVPAKYPLAVALASRKAPGLFSPKLPSAASYCPPLPPFTGSTGLYGKEVHREEKPTVFWAPIVFTTGYTTERWEAASWTVLTRMFEPIDPGGDVAKGGLGINEAEFVQEAYAPTFRTKDGGAITSTRFAASTHFVSLASCSWIL